MVFFDVNILVYCHRSEIPDHLLYRKWLEGIINSSSAYGISNFALSGFARVVTHPRIFKPPSTLKEALTFIQQLREQPNAVFVNPGPFH